MKIAVIGGAGQAGLAIVCEAVKRNHQVDIIDPSILDEQIPEGVEVIKEDALTLGKDDFEIYDVIINAMATSINQAYLHVDLTTKLIANFREDEDTRLVFLLGAGSLLAGVDQHLVLDDMRNFPEIGAGLRVQEAQLHQLRFLESVDNVDWVAISPSLEFGSGPAREPVLGSQTLLFNEDGESLTSTGTMAVAVLDEIENARHTQERFTVLDGDK